PRAERSSDQELLRREHPDSPRLPPPRELPRLPARESGARRSVLRRLRSDIHLRALRVPGDRAPSVSLSAGGSDGLGKISVFGASGFVGSRFCALYPDECAAEPRSAERP